MPGFLLPLLILSPLAASVILFLLAKRISARGAGLLAAGSVGFSAVISMVLAFLLLSRTNADPFQITLWEWMRTADLSAGISLLLDPVSLVMILVVTVVGFLIHLYAARYMADDPGIARFFGCMTLFVAAMLVLVLASDLFCLFIGWEGVGLCSYLLIGFWYENPANTAAARKAFYITRIGDTAMLCGLLLLMTSAGGSLQISHILSAVTTGQLSSSVVSGAALFLLIGALAKSAQIPFQTWLPDAMAGPTPTSALIHAATMVTAGVYLIARLHVLFTAAPLVMTLMAVTGTLTLLMAACTALVQTDLKRILAWSTISQLGYMFLALGTGIWQAALFHLVTHAFFKALLFLTAGAIIARVHHEQNIFRMGGLFRAMPGVAVAFLAGASALAGLPLITAGFYSKEMILSSVWSASFALAPGLALSGHLLWGAALAGAFLTALYIFRCVFIIFPGQPQTAISGRTPRLMAIPLACLAFLSLAGGFVEMPDALATVHLFTHMLAPAAAGSSATISPDAVSHMTISGAEAPRWLLLAGGIAPVAGLAVAWVLWGRTRPVMREVPGQAAIMRLARAGSGTDRLYDVFFVQPFRFLAWLTRHDIIDGLITGAGRTTRRLSLFFLQVRAGSLGLASAGTITMTREGDLLLTRLQNGRVRWYAAWIVAGLCAALASALLA